ncbi:MAG: hypothetical protein QM800_02030 [Paludibacter sp.]
MRNFNRKLFKASILFVFFMACFIANAAQRRYSPLSTAATSDYKYTIANDVQVSDRELEFDLYLQDIDASQPFELANIQAGITVNPAIINGGTITMSIVPGSSGLVNPGGGASPLVPTSVTFTQAQNAIKLAPKAPPGTGSGPIISTIAPGTRIIRLRMTNTVAFATNSKVDYTFSFTTTPYPTKVFQYIGGLNTQITSDATNCFSNATNMALNKPISAQTVTGSGTYCQGDAGVVVGLAGSEVGVTYTLYKNAVATTTTVVGTGSAVSFPAQTVGTYTVKGSYVNGVNVWGTTDMTGNAVITEMPTITAGVSIAADVNNVCEGTTVIYTATPTNGGTAPVYQWYKGATPVGTNSAIYSYVPVNGDAIKVVMTSNATPCLVGSPVTSNVVSMTVNPNLTANVTIAADANNVCTGTTVTYTATPTNGGTAPVYQWYKGTTPVGTNSATYSYVPVNGDAIKVVMTSNATPCLVGSPVTSNVVSMTVNPNLTANVTIAADANNVCAGTTVTYTATPTNGGTAPVYQWYNGATPVGTNSATYSYVPVNGDAIKVVMTSNATPCLVGSPVTSNVVSMTVNPNLTANVTIAADANNVCAGTTVTYTATPTNGGTAPVYQWYKGATPVGTNSATYSYVPVNGDAIKVVMTSNATPCLVGSPVTSNVVSMTVNPNLTANVTIAADANNVCVGTTVTYTATPTNGGTAPVYQWYKGTTPVGTNSATYSYVPANGDAIKVVMTSNATPCLVGSPVTSNVVSMTVNPNLTAGVSIAADANNVCSGTTVTYTATPTNGGTTPVYQWYKGATPVGTNSATYSYVPVNGDAIKVVMTSNATPCLVGSPVTSNVVIPLYKWRKGGGKL